MRAGIVLGLGMALWIQAGLARAQESKGGIAPRMIGTYKLVSGSNGGKEIPKEHLDGQVRITKDAITTYDAEHKEVYVLRYNIDREGEPARIAMTVTSSSRPDAAGTKAVGLVKADGDTLTLIYDYKGREFPSDFEPKGDSQNLFVLKRAAETK